MTALQRLRHRLRERWRRFWEALTRPFRAVWAFFTEPPQERPMDQVLEEAIRHPESLWVHLEALRRHVARAVVVYIIVAFASLALVPQTLAFLAAPIGGVEHLQAIEVTEPIGVSMRVALLVAFVLTLPYIYLELFFFVAPGLYPRTRVLGLFLMPLVLALFLAGMAFAYRFFLPVALPFLLNFMGIPAVPRPASYIRFVTTMLFWSGLAFEYPLVIFVLARLGWVQARALWKHWRIAVVAIAVLAAFITPTVDPLNMILVMAPLTALYFIGAVLATIAQRKAPGRADSPSSQKEEGA